jgi:flavin-dependent dehydrogenase
MRKFDVVVVGGGPAGSACAARLVQAGAEVLVVDRESFPRTKLCAGWITPQVIEDLSFDVASYPHRFNTFDNIVVHVKGFTFKLAGPQHSIRRYEFDDYLLRTCGAEIVHHNVKHIEEKNGAYTVDDSFQCEYLVGAGGTRCPVYRSFFRELNPRAKELQAATYEHEFAYEWEDPRCHLWFFDKGLPGYAWYVPKARGYLNCGIGGMAVKLKMRGEDIKTHWNHFADALARKELVRNFEFAPKGYSYYLRGDVDVVRVDNAFITGDAAGLATRDLCEGIGPAIQSGQRAADSIMNGSVYSLETIDAFSANRAWVRTLLGLLFTRRGGRTAEPLPEDTDRAA